MERADQPFIKAMDYIVAAVRLDNAAAEQDAVTAGRLQRLAASFRERAAKALSDRWIMA